MFAYQTTKQGFGYLCLNSDIKNDYLKVYHYNLHIMQLYRYSNNICCMRQQNVLTPEM